MIQTRQERSNEDAPPAVSEETIMSSVSGCVAATATAIGRASKKFITKKVLTVLVFAFILYYYVSDYDVANTVRESISQHFDAESVPVVLRAHVGKSSSSYSTAPNVKTTLPVQNDGDFEFVDSPNSNDSLVSPSESTKSITIARVMETMLNGARTNTATSLSVDESTSSIFRTSRPNPTTGKVIATSSTNNPPMMSKLEAADDLNMLKQTLSNTSPKPPDPVSVIILTQKRSGSSFFGEIFNQNDNFTYFYEPLTSLTIRVMRHEMSNGMFPVYAQQIFNGLCHRDFSHMPTGWWSNSVPDRTCRSSTIASSSPGLCKKSRHFLKHAPTLMQKMQLLGAATKKRTGLAIKTIRIQDLNTIKDVVSDASLNVKILHLVRDPRGVINSRRKMHEGNTDLARRKGRGADEIRDLCEHYDRNLKTGSIAGWLHGRYKLVRYEDVAENPLPTSAEIYKFIGMDAPASVKKWLYNNTRFSKGGSFSVTRNSKQTAAAWETELDRHIVREIQQKCADSMAKLGYKPVV